MQSPIAEKKIFDEQAVTGANSYTGSPTFIGGLEGVSYQFQWTGNPTGTFGFEVSNNITGPNDSAALWTPLSTSLIAGYSGVNPAGSANNSVVEIEIKAKAIRPTYTNSAGSGVLRGWVVGKAR